MGFWRDMLNTIYMRSTTHRPDGSTDVFLFSSPRSGSTWLMELIYTQPGFRWCREPFDLRKAVVKDHLSITEWEEFHSPQATEKFEPYIRSFVEGKIRDRRIRHPRPFGQYYRPLTRRTVFKILHAGEERINWFRDTFQGQIVFLIRHPIPVTLSHEVHPRLEAFVYSDYADHFTQEQMGFARQTLAYGTKFECGILDWCFQNALPLQQRTDDWVVVTYEQLVLNPDPIITRLARRLDLPNPERVNNRLTVPSDSAMKSDATTQQRLKEGRSQELNTWLVEKWRSKVSAEQEKRAMEILSIFNIDIYQMGSSLPVNRFWIQSEKIETL